MAKGWPATSVRMLAMMMLGGVPIRVIRPPRMVPNDSGISNSAGGRSDFLAASMVAGISSASAPMLFMNADSTAPTPDSRPICAVRLRTGGSITAVNRSIAPDTDSARLTISTAATVITAGWPKPEKAWPAGTSPMNTAPISAVIATRS